MIESKKLLKYLIICLMGNLNDGKSWIILNKEDLHYIDGTDGMLRVLECFGVIELTEYDEGRQVQHLKISRAAVDALDHWKFTENTKVLTGAIAALNSH